MELREWQYINKPAGNSTTASTSSNTGNKSFKKRFDKIIKYYGDHLPAEVDYVLVNLLTNGSLNFTENYDNGDKVQYDIFIDDFDTEDWGIKIKVNGQPTEKYFDKGWAKLLNTLGAYIELPQMGDPEYKSLLTEWVAMNNKASSSGYKKRFEKLIKYHIDHASSELESVTTKDISNWHFRLGEHYNTGSQEFDREIAVSVDKATNTFYLNIFVDGKQVYHNDYKSYEEVLEILTDTYMFLPDEDTQEYNNLLVEWVAMKNSTASNSQPASSITGGYWKRFNKLIYYHVTHKGRDVDKVIRTKVSKDGFHYTEHHRGGVSGYEYDVVVNIDLATDHWTFQTSVDGKPRLGGAGDGYLELLKELRKHMNLPAKGTPDYDSLLTESLNEWKLMNPPASSSAPSGTGSFESYKNRFNKLFDYATKHKHSSVAGTEIEKLSEDEHTSMFHFTHHVLGGAQGFDYDLEVILAINKPQGNWFLLVYEFDGKSHDKIVDLTGSSYSSLLIALSDYIEVPAAGSSEYKDLLQESINTSIADDFKLYENLWD